MRQRGLSFFIGSVLLVLYLVGVVKIGSFHSAIHAPAEKELHSAVNETNACHQSIYHNVKEQSCEHKSHIVSLKKCALCHLTLQSLHLYNLKSSDEFVISTASDKCEKQTSIIGAVFTLIPSRGPPSV